MVIIMNLQNLQSVHCPLRPAQGGSGDISTHRGAQLRAMANGSQMDLDSLSAAQLRWLAACIASMPQQPQEQLPLQLPGMAPGDMHMPLHQRSVCDPSMMEDDPVRADLSHGILHSPGGGLDAGQAYFDPTQMSQGSSISQQVMVSLPHPSPPPPPPPLSPHRAQHYVCILCPGSTLVVDS